MLFSIGAAQIYIPTNTGHALSCPFCCPFLSPRIHSWALHIVDAQVKLLGWMNKGIHGLENTIHRLLWGLFHSSDTFSDEVQFRTLFSLGWTSGVSRQETQRKSLNHCLGWQSSQASDPCRQVLLLSNLCALVVKYFCSVLFNTLFWDGYSQQDYILRTGVDHKPWVSLWFVIKEVNKRKSVTAYFWKSSFIETQPHPFIQVLSVGCFPYHSRVTLLQWKL